MVLNISAFGLEIAYSSPFRGLGIVPPSDAYLKMTILVVSAIKRENWSSGSTWVLDREKGKRQVGLVAK